MNQLFRFDCAYAFKEGKIQGATFEIWGTTEGAEQLEEYSFIQDLIQGMSVIELEQLVSIKINLDSLPAKHPFKFLVDKLGMYKFTPETEDGKEWFTCKQALMFLKMTDPKFCRALKKRSNSARRSVGRSV
jgi:hypothetical protein